MKIILLLILFLFAETSMSLADAPTQINLCPLASKVRLKQFDVVFMGDSITHRWFILSKPFFSPDELNAGGNGQTTAQMAARFCKDVIDHHPKIVHILGGINDIGGKHGNIPLKVTEANLASMAETAEASGIKVIMGSVLPTTHIPWMPGQNPNERIRALNNWIFWFSRKNHLIYANYYGALATDNGSMREGLSSDGVHPTSLGYAVMNPIAEKALQTAVTSLH